MRTMRFGSTWLSLLGGGLLAAGCVGAAPEGETSAELRAFTSWSTPVHVVSLPVYNSAGVLVDDDGSISTTRNDQRPTFSKDGLSLYFSSNRAGAVGSPAPFEGTDLYVSRRASVDDVWGNPVKVTALNSAGDDNAPAISPDGHYIYFGSTRAGGCGNFDIYVARRQDANDDLGWETPVNLGCGVNSPQNDDGPTYTKDENGVAGLYFTSARLTNNVEWDIFLALATDADGKVNFGTPALVAELSSPKRDTRTALSKDGLDMFITSNALTANGTVHILYSNRASTAAAWSKPVAVPKINALNANGTLSTTVQDGAPSLSHDGMTLYFDSTRSGGGADGGRDLWMSTREKAPGGDE